MKDIIIMAEISFTSRIIPLNQSTFSRITARIPQENAVNYPWTINETVIAPNVYTTGIFDCTSCIFTNGQNAMLLHLTPDNPNNQCFPKILDFIKSHINLNDENLQAMLVGSQNTKHSQNIYTKIIDLLKQFNIPHSELKTSKNPTSIAYRSDTDEIYVTNEAIDKFYQFNKNTNYPESALKNGFEKVSIAECDEIATYY